MREITQFYHLCQTAAYSAIHNRDYEYALSFLEQALAARAYAMLIFGDADQGHLKFFYKLCDELHSVHAYMHSRARLELRCDYEVLWKDLYFSALNEKIRA